MASLEAEFPGHLEIQFAPHLEILCWFRFGSSSDGRRRGLCTAQLSKCELSAWTLSRVLEYVLPNEVIFEGRLFTVYPTRKYLSAKVRTFIDFLAADIAGPQRP
jgi:hypothetical protein